MYKIRTIAFSLIFALLVPIAVVPVQVKAASNVSDFSRLAGTAAPVLTAITTCTLGLLFDKVSVALQQTEEDVSGVISAKVAVSGGAIGGISKSAQAAQTDKLRNTCLIPIERAAAQVILNTITTETINWINGGMNGSPLYNQNLNTSLAKMQNNALVKLAADISDPNLYPFGKDILKSALSKFHTTYRDSSASNINDVIGASFPGAGLKEFSKNLLLGGWGAFDSGFSPNNNAIGFNFQTQDHIIAEFQGTAYSQAQSLKDELSWGHGFLSQKKCLDPGFDETGTSTCENYKITTPGEVVSAKLDKALGNQEDALNLGQNLDASITSIFNAMITKLLQNGLSSLSDDTGNNSNADTTKNANSGAAQQATVTGNATAGSLCGVTSSTDWWNQFPRFNLWRDLVDSTATSTDINGNIITVTNPGLMTREQQLEYILVAQNNVIKWTKKAIYILDMCIPGPSSISNSRIKNLVYGDIMQDYNYPGSSDDQVNEIYNAQFLSDNFGVRYFPDERIKSPSAVQKIAKTLISRYYDAMMSEYGNLSKIDSYTKVQQYFSKLGFYDQQLADNEAKIGLIKGTISQLNTIEKRLENIDPTSPTGDKTLSPEAVANRYAKIKQQFEALIPDLDVSPYVSKK